MTLYWGLINKDKEGKKSGMIKNWLSSKINAVSRFHCIYMRGKENVVVYFIWKENIWKKVWLLFAKTLKSNKKRVQSAATKSKKINIFFEHHIFSAIFSLSSDYILNFFFSCLESLNNFDSFSEKAKNPQKRTSLSCSKTWEVSLFSANITFSSQFSHSRQIASFSQ